jgi:TadE-like protein
MRARRRHGERGATLTEFAVVGLLLFTVLFGIFEFGMLFRNRTTTSDAAADGARVGAIQGPNRTSTGETADYSIIKAIREDSSAIDPEAIEQIVIFKGSSSGSGSPASQVPATCKAGTPVAGRCNVYNPNTAFERVQEGDASYFDCSTNPTGPACSWDPVTRRNGPRPTDIEYLGVWIRVNHQWVTGLFGDGFTYESASVVRLEPGTFE